MNRPLNTLAPVLCAGSIVSRYVQQLMTHQLATAIMQTDRSLSLWDLIEAMDKRQAPTFTRDVCTIEWLGGIVAASTYHNRKDECDSGEFR